LDVTSKDAINIRSESVQLVDFLLIDIETTDRKSFPNHAHMPCSGFKSFQPKQGKPAPPPDDPGNPTVNFRGEKRSNETHASKTDPDAQRARKSDGKESKLSYSGNLLVENRNGLIVNAEVFAANGTAERDAALVMLEQIPGNKRGTAGGDKGFDTRDFVAESRHLGGRRMWRRTWDGAAGARSTGRPRIIPAIVSVRKGGSASKNASAR
jgi:hypothetical protein